MKYVKWILIALFCLPFVLLIGGSCFNTCTEEGCNPIDYAKITDVEYRAEVVDKPGGHGKIIITERITFDIHAAFKSNLFWELWRDLCEDQYDGIEVTYNVLSVKQILEDGTEIIFEESPVLYWEDEDYVNTNTRLGPGKWYHSPGPYDEGMRRYECVFFYVDGIYREEMVFEIQYEMYNAALRYGDCSDLYISMYSGDSIYDLESFKAEVLVPDELMPSPGNYLFTTYGTVANGFEVEESATKNPGYYTFSMELDKKELKFTPYNEFLEFDLVAFGEDKHIFTENASYNDYYFDYVLTEIIDEQDEYAALPGRYKVIKMIIFSVFMVLSGLVVYYGFHKKHKMMTKYCFYNPDVEYDQFREIPSDLDPQFAACLVFCKDKKKPKESDIYAALMLSLARKDYIELRDNGKNDIDIYIRKCPYKGPQMAVPAGGQAVFSQPNYSQPSFGNTYSGVDPSLTGNAHTGIDLTYNPAFSTSYSQNGSVTHVNHYTINVNNAIFKKDTVDSNAPLAFFSDLTASESHFFSLLVRHAKDNFITMKEFKNAIANDYANTDTFLNKIKDTEVNVGVQQCYLQTATYKRPRNSMLGSATLFSVLGWLALIPLNLISRQSRVDYAFGAYTIFALCCFFTAWYLRKNGRNLVLLTALGESEYAKWRGLYNFLNSSTLIKERSHVELPLWEQYLVYATAFGLSDKITKAIHICCPEYNSSDVLRANGHHSHRIRSYGRGIHSSVRSGSSIARSGGGGFGYGGGGRGGGGGGGGH